MSDPRSLQSNDAAGAPRPRDDWHLEILYRDDHLVAVNKPTALLVHRSPVSRDRDFAVQRLREQLGRRVFPAHRLDRATSGVLLFSLDPETGRAAAMSFQEGRVDKRYLAVVRGWTEESGTIEHALKSEDKNRKRDAVTHYRRLATTEIDEPVGPHPTARYSLLAFRPKTGRRHQLRRHANHIAHPIVGDTTHGDGRHNKFFRRRFGIHRLLLHAWSLELEHPVTGKQLRITAPIPTEFRELLEGIGWEVPQKLPTVP